MRCTRKSSRLKTRATKKAKELMDSQMPRNTNFTSNAARQRIAEIIIDMVFEEFYVDKKSKGILARLRSKVLG